MPRSILFIGGCRSGKSALAQQWAESCGPKRLYIATCIPRDTEMKERVARHQAARGKGWTTLECPALETSLLHAAYSEGRPDVMLVDCLTLWLGILFERQINAEQLHSRFAELAAFIRTAPCPVALVANELGMGMVPADGMTRAFRDAAGEMHQAVAAVCETVLFVTSGLPLALKGSIPPACTGGIHA